MIEALDPQHRTVEAGDTREAMPVLKYLMSMTPAELLLI
jgi:hypothetical protein